MLPFGLTTDVSAGALAAGAGGALGAAPASGGVIAGGETGGFAHELKAVAGQALAQDGGTAGQAGAAESALETLQLLKTSAELPEGAVLPQDVVPGTLPEVAVLEEDQQMPVAEAGVDVAETEDTSQPAAPAGEISLAALAPAHMGAVMSPAVSPDGAVLPQVAVPSVEAGAGGVAPPAIGQATGSAAGAVPGAAPVTPTPAQPSQSASSGMTPPATAAATPQTAGEGVPAGLPSQPAGESLQQVAAPAGRRWQTELPQEFRAPSTVPAQPRPAGPVPTVEMQLPAVATAGAAGTPAAGLNPPPVVQVTAAAPVQQAVTDVSGSMTGGTPTAALQSQTAADFMTKAPSTPVQPVASQGIGAMPADGQAPVSQAVGAPAAAPAVVSTAGQPAVQPQVLTQVQTSAATGETPVVAVPELDAALDQDIDGDVLPLKPLSADTAPATGAKPAAAGGTGTAGPANAERGPGAPQNTAAAMAAPVAAAALAPALSEEAELPPGVLEPETGSEFTTATVRGGDMSGAMRTESLQTPNQAQSTQVATQVAAEIVRNLKNGQTQFQMRFDPPELGRVEVNMRVAADGSVQAHLIVERPETLDMFLRDQRGLERALEAAGLNPGSDNLQFSLKQDGGQDMAGGQDNRNGSGGADEGVADGAGEADPDVSDRVRLMLAEQRGGLDMKV
ncbi:flagellar hook-length control protein FliK [Labrenzia sp. VG12]|uniref:flagellar hook-length control protein FliK n=1 Tax=Labrenzia sp. VG12 TaxID=2021862 RepID=UPI0012FD676F|nr:flagellar hook-length control protein FliK [Labrenzia sp. VG12]